VFSQETMLYIQCEAEFTIPGYIHHLETGRCIVLHTPHVRTEKHVRFSKGELHAVHVVPLQTRSCSAQTGGFSVVKHLHLI